MENQEKIIPHLLVCYDGTPASYKILSYLKEVFENQKLEITLLKIVEHPASFETIETDVYKKLQKEMLIEERAKETFSKTEKELKAVSSRLKNFISGKFHFRVLFKYGDIAESIITFSQQNQFDGILVGRRGLSKISTFILGGVTHKLISLSTIPVWLIRGDNWNRKILVPFDLSETGLKLVDYVSFIFSSHNDIKITFFHVPHPFEKLKIFEGTLEELIESSKNKNNKEFFTKMKEILLENAIPIERLKFKIKSSIFGPAGEIIKLAKKEDYKTIVIGRRGRGKAKEFFLGSVSSKIISYFNDRAIWVLN